MEIHYTDVVNFAESLIGRMDAFNHHGPRVMVLLQIFGTEYGLSPHEVEMLRVAGALHDVGKLGISETILNAPRRLSPNEFDQVKTHTTKGYSIFHGLGYDPIICDVALHHHERWNGNGYPDGLAGTEISIHARMTAIVDVYDAMTHHRSYRLASPFELVKAEMLSLGGTWFDPDLLTVFFSRVITHG